MHRSLHHPTPPPHRCFSESLVFFPPVAPHHCHVSCAKLSFNPFQPVRRRLPFFFPQIFFFTFHFHPFFPLPAFSRSSFFRSPENSIFFTRPARPENTANPVSAQRAGEVKILGHLFSTSRTYETPFPPFPLTSMRPIATTSDRSRASLGGERFRRVDARLSTRRGRQAPTWNIRSSLV